MTNTDKLNGLKLWQAIELLTPASPPSPSSGDQEKSKTKYLDKRVPWLPTPAVKTDAKGGFILDTHLIHGRPYSTTRFLALLPIDADSYEKASGLVSPYTFRVDHFGLPVPGSFRISSATWAIAQILKDPTWLLGSLSEDLADVFESAQEGLAHYFDEEARRILSKSVHKSSNEKVSTELEKAREAFKSKPYPDYSATLSLIKKGLLTNSPMDLDELKRLEDTLTSNIGFQDLYLPAYAFREIARKVLQLYPAAELQDVSRHDEAVEAILKDIKDDSRTSIVQSKTINERFSDDEQDADDGIINSAFLGELHRAIEGLGSGRGCLDSYLDSEPRDAARVDTRLDSKEVFEAYLSPNKFPEGAWPSPHPLVYSQQVAINAIWDKLSDGKGIFSVNGPPGTGKTTLLRDLIAAIVVKRASLIVSGEEFFSKQRDHITVRGGFRISNPFAINPAFDGFEIVVASANNGAVENITRELPALKEIGEEFRLDMEGLSYFEQLSDSLFNPKDSDGDAEPIETWGLFSAPLGKSSNKFAFERAVNGTLIPNESDPQNAYKGIGGVVQQFLDKSPVSPDAYLQESKSKFEGLQREISLLANHLQEYKMKAADLKYNLAIQDHIEKKSDELKVKLQDLGHTIDSLTISAHDSVATLSQAAKDSGLESRLVAAGSDVDLAKKSWQQIGAEKDKLNARLASHDKIRPKGFLGIFRPNYNDMAQWNSKRDEIEEALLAINAPLTAAAQTLKQKEDEQASLLAENKRILAEIEQIQDSLRRETAPLEEAFHRISADLDALGHEHTRISSIIREEIEFTQACAAQHPGIDQDYLALEEDERELSSPWNVGGIRKLQARLFIAALHVHRAYFLVNREEFLKNFDLVTNLMKGNISPKMIRDNPATADYVQDAWRTLFFVVPVISSTFTSFSRLFYGMKPGSLGWVLMDESGQAAPQQAVGAMHLARRAVVVGDPLQLDPVVTIPVGLQKGMARVIQAKEDWLPSYSSVQIRADAISTLGARISPNGQDVWVGAPLRVHRRCDYLMFDIANRISYDNLMVYGKSSRDSHALHGLRSCWIDAPSEDRDGAPNFNQVEIDTARDLLDHLASMPPDPNGKRALNSVFLISPFRDTASKLMAMEKQYGIEGRVGTIHKAQGKEAGIVILVLGGSKPGARAWAASKPNLLNVAATRAKTVLIVIGDHAKWRDKNYFDVASRTLPVQTHDELAGVTAVVL